MVMDRSGHGPKWSWTEVVMDRSGHTPIDGAGHPGLSIHSGTLPRARHGAGLKTNALFSLRFMSGRVAFKRITINDVAPSPAIGIYAKCPIYTYCRWM